MSDNKRIRLLLDDETYDALSALSHYFGATKQDLAGDIFAQAVGHTLNFVIKQIAEKERHADDRKAESSGAVEMVRGEGSDSHLLADQKAGNDSAAAAPVG